MENDKFFTFLQNNSLNGSTINVQDTNKFNEFIHNDLPYDLVLDIQDKNNIITFKGHKLILSNQCTYFKNLLMSGFNESHRKNIILEDTPNCYIFLFF